MAETKVNKAKSEIARWLARIEKSQLYRKKAAQRYRWDRLIEEYRGYFSGLTDSADIYIPPLNYMYAYIKSEIPALAQRNPKFKVNPKKGSSIVSARIIEAVLNYLWRSKHIKQQSKKNLFDTMVTGHSWFKTGYTGKFGAVDEANKEYQFIESEDFFGYRIPYDNITFNPDSNDPPFDSAWIAHEIWIPLNEAKQNKMFKHTESLKPATVRPDEAILTAKSEDERNRRDPDMEMVKLYEVWDKNSHTVFTISEGCDNYLQEPRKWPYKMPGFPFSFLRLNDDPTTPYGIPDVFPFEAQIIELMKIRASELDHLKRFNRQLMAEASSIDNDAMEQFKQGVTGAVIPVRTNGKPISEVIAPISYPPLPTDIYGIEQRIRDDIDNISGQSAVDRGARQATASRTLGELQQVEQGGNGRRSDKVDIFQDFLKDVAGNLVCLLQQFVDVPMYVGVTGENAAAILQAVKARPSAGAKGSAHDSAGFTFTKDDISGEYDFEIVPGSTTPLDEDHKKAVTVQLLDLVARFQLGNGPVMKALMDELADCIDMPSLKIALQQEEKIFVEKQQAASEQAKQTQQMQIAQQTAETQIKAEREAARQNDLVLKGVKMAHEMRGGGAKPEANKGPAESISFKDLPESGKVQMAKQAGITLSPSEVEPAAPPAAKGGLPNE